MSLVLVNEKQSDSPAPTPPPPPPLGRLLETLALEDLANESAELASFAEIRDSGVVASYNWVVVEGSDSKILIPGKPRRWTPPTPPRIVDVLQDTGIFYSDKNAARCPNHPMEPAVIACLDADPTLPSKVDVMACGSTLGNLLRFACGEDRSFRILVEKVKNTVFFIRRENSPKQVIPNVKGFGHTFPEACTTWETDVEGSESHQRMIRYNFGQLNFVVRSEADGYLSPNSEPLPTKSAPDSVSAGKGKEQDKPPVERSVEDLVALASNMLLAAQIGTGMSSSGAVQTKRGGSPVDQQQVFEIETRNNRVQQPEVNLGDELLSRLWVSQVPNLILAFHRHGRFKPEDIIVQDVRRDVARWEEENVKDLTLLAAVVRRIIKSVSAAPNGKLELCQATAGILEVREQLPYAGTVLSPEVRARWERATAVSTTKKQCEQNDDFLMEKDGVSDEWESDPESETEWDDGDGKDFTACSETCGYCGRCSY
ncbi:hypothetical protein B0H63DRAFT_468179 [Podospora didyma]|uniref:Geranylgeranyl pyrophosphate synthetase n=1 Tax=Podospora didyma TaxID=330526 RepID=A0AAE0NS22_9PEZI|nr:hypothetical protein B0H63DRAFT_468179 [Podospora didyma]